MASVCKEINHLDNQCITRVVASQETILVTAYTPLQVPSSAQPSDWWSGSASDDLPPLLQR